MRHDTRRSWTIQKQSIVHVLVQSHGIKTALFRARLRPAEVGRSTAVHQTHRQPHQTTLLCLWVVAHSMPPRRHLQYCTCTAALQHFQYCRRAGQQTTIPAHSTPGSCFYIQPLDSCKHVRSRVARTSDGHGHVCIIIHTLHTAFHKHTTARQCVVAVHPCRMAWQQSRQHDDAAVDDHTAAAVDEPPPHHPTSRMAYRLCTEQERARSNVPVRPDSHSQTSQAQHHR